MKKLVALLLSMAMVLGGIYWVEMEGSEVKAANAQSDFFKTKVQVATDESNVIRFVSSVESLDYKEVGFEVTPEGGQTKTYTTTTVYERIESTTEGVEYTFSPKVVDVDSEYFFTAKLRAEADVNYTVKAFGVPAGQTERLYGETRCVGVIDGKAANLLNLTYTTETVPTKGSTIDVTYGSANTPTTAEVIAVNGNDVTVRITLNPTQLPSATKFDFGTYGSTIYRNLYTKYTGTGTDDQTWYDVYKENDPELSQFTIATSADLYGFMNMMIDQNLFKNQTIYLISDIAMNDNVSDAVVESWATGAATPAYQWTAAGTDSTATQFTGTFDGQMHTISGVYMNQNKQRAGFFGCTAKESLVKNFYLIDSYFKSTFTTDVQHLGSVAGECWGDMENVYSDAIVAGSHNRVGGLIGVLNTVTAAEALGMQAEVNNCWFDGEVRMTTDNGRYFGGIVGYVMQKEVQIKDCLFTGKLTYTYKSGGVHAGGILGGNNNKPTVHMEDVVSAGEILGEYWVCTGTVHGYASTSGTTYDIVNAYGTVESMMVAEGATGTSGQTSGGKASGATVNGPGTTLAEANLQGINAYKNTLLDFENTWVARTGKVPALKVFDKMYTASEVITDFGTTAQDGWYDANNNRYGIHTVDGLYGLATVSKSQNFSGKTIYLSKDIDMNPDWVAPKDAETAVTGNPKAFDAILFSSDHGGKALVGTFDGRQHTIRGLYINSTGSPTALFGRVNAGGTIKNLAVTNAYVKQNNTGGAWAAGVLGYCFGGTVDGVYCNATVIKNATTAQAGGVIGRAEGTIKNCWFDGNLLHIGETDGKVELGGIAGRSWGRTSATAALRVTSFTNCLNTGNISYNPTTAGGTGAGIGGILGTDTGYSELTISNCVNLGQIDTNKANGVGGCIGMLSGNNKKSDGTYDWVNATVKNCYTSSDCIINKGSAKVLAYKNANSVVTESGNAAIARTTLESAAIYENASILLDYTSWIARSNGSPIPTVFVDWIVPASQTVAKPATE